MASLLKLGVDTGQWDAGLKKAQQALNAFTQSQGGLQKALEKDNGDMQKFIQMMGKMDSTANTAKGQMNDYKRVIEQLSAEYEKMSSAQKASIGKDYLQTIDSLKQKFQQAKQHADDLNRSLNNISDAKMPSINVGSGMQDPFAGLAGKFTLGNIYTMGIDAAINAIGTVTDHITDLMERSAELAVQAEGVRKAFERINQPGLLNELRDATHGTVTDLELMKQAVKFKDFNLDLKSMGTLMAFAQQKAKDTGQSVDYMVDSITTGLGRKSLMILDNLGLSAAEIKKKMEETGDMTTAVAAIIEQRMAESGDYYETTADRITQANVKLENAMTELGDQIQSTFGKTSDEISADFERALTVYLTDVLRGVEVTTDGIERISEEIKNTFPLLVELKNGFEDALSTMSENSPVMKAAIDGIKSVGDAIATYILLNMAPGTFALNQLAGIGKNNKPIYGGGVLGSSISSLLPQTSKEPSQLGLIEAQEQKVKDLESAWKKATDAASQKQLKKELDEANAVLDIMRGKSTGGGTYKKEDAIIHSGSFADLSKQMRELQDAQKLVTNAREWDDYNEKIRLIRIQIKELKGELVSTFADPMTAWSQGKGKVSVFNDVQKSALANVDKQKENLKNKDIGKLLDKTMKYIEKSQKDNKKEVSVMGEVSKMAGGINSIASGIEALGVELPEDLKNVLNGLQGIISIVSGIATVVTAIQSIQMAQMFKFWSGGGVVHAATGLIVPGNNYSGDMVPSMINSGELILNRAQQGVLASALNDNDHDGGNARPYVSGEQIYLGLNNYLRRTGRGELLTARY